MSFNYLFKLDNNFNLMNRNSNKTLKFLVISILFFIFTVGFSTISKILSTNGDVVVYPVAMMRTSSSNDSYAYKNDTYRKKIKTILLKENRYT